MSYKVLVIPEDFTKDEHVLKPLVEKMLEDSGKTQAKVEVCRDPNFQGVDATLNSGRLRDEVVRRYPMVDLFLVLVDRDGKDSREAKAADIENKINSELAQKRRLFAELAHQEVEVFILAGHDLPSEWSGQAVRRDHSVKDTYFREFVRIKGTATLPHDGRKRLMAEAVKRWPHIKSLCPEDVGRLLNKISAIRA